MEVFFLSLFFFFFCPSTVVSKNQATTKELGLNQPERESLSETCGKCINTPQTLVQDLESNEETKTWRIFFFKEQRKLNLPLQTLNFYILWFQVFFVLLWVDDQLVKFASRIKPESYSLISLQCSSADILLEPCLCYMSVYVVLFFFFDTHVHTEGLNNSVNLPNQ